MRNISSNSALPFARVRSLASCFKSSIIITEAVFRREAVVGICRLCLATAPFASNHLDSSSWTFHTTTSIFSLAPSSSKLLHLSTCWKPYFPLARLILQLIHLHNDAALKARLYTVKFTVFIVQTSACLDHSQR